MEWDADSDANQKEIFCSGNMPPGSGETRSFSQPDKSSISRAFNQKSTASGKDSKNLIITVLIVIIIALIIYIFTSAH
jgi:hypothetical protein